MLKTIELEMDQIATYMEQGVWPGSMETTNFLKEMLSATGEFNPYFVLDSSCKKTGEALNLPCLYTDYKMPNGLSYDKHKKLTRVVEIYTGVDFIKKGIGSRDWSKVLSGDYKDLASKWLDENKRILVYINKLNDRLIELNPELKIVNRKIDEYYAEVDLMYGIYFKRNPSDINYFLQMSEANQRPASYDAVHQLAETLINNIDSGSTHTRPLKLYWVVSPQTVLDVLTHFNPQHNQTIETITDFATRLQKEVPNYVLHKEYLPEWTTVGISDMLGPDTKLKQLSKEEHRTWYPEFSVSA